MFVYANKYLRKCVYLYLYELVCASVSVCKLLHLYEITDACACVSVLACELLRLRLHSRGWIFAIIMFVCICTIRPAGERDFFPVRNHTHLHVWPRPSSFPSGLRCAPNAFLRALPLAFNPSLPHLPFLLKPRRSRSRPFP